MANRDNIEIKSIVADNEEKLEKEVNNYFHHKFHDKLDLIDIKFFASEKKFHAMVITKKV